MKTGQKKRDYYPWLNIKADHKNNLAAKLKRELIETL